MKNSSVVIEKSKFFIYRMVVYFSFLMIPVYIQKTQALSLLSQTILMALYACFMCSQWYLLGKEVDHRLKIYFRANSSLDRILYRLLVGSSVTVIIFNLFNFLPENIVRHFFWGFWVFLGLFYSWPTRGKIIEESVSGQFSEYRYLDGFEKVALFLTGLMCLVSFPSFPLFENLDSLRLYIDPDEKILEQFWNFLSMNYFPFKNYPQMMYLSWCVHFFLVGMIMYLLSVYGILRFFFSRRLSILGIFALVSSWSFSLGLARDPFHMLLATFSPIWVWSLLWCVKSSTYRSGLLFGLVHFAGVLLNFQFILLWPVSILLMNFLFMKDKNSWYRRQFFKYSSFGLFLSVVAVLSHYQFEWFDSAWKWSGFVSNLSYLIKRKAFYVLSFFGLLSLINIYRKDSSHRLSTFSIEKDKLFYILLLMMISCVFGVIVDQTFTKGFGLLWILVFLSLLPLEWVFQVISRLRSRRNMIYLIYVLFCLLDSHIEGRFRIAAKFFNTNTMDARHIND